MLAHASGTSSVPPQFLWKQLGYAHLLSLGNMDRARECFTRYEKLILAENDTSNTSPTTETIDSPATSKNNHGDDTALNALSILRNENPKLAEFFAAAMRARLQPNFSAMSSACAKMLKLAPDLDAVQSEYLRALDGYDREVYFSSPWQRKSKTQWCGSGSPPAVPGAGSKWRTRRRCARQAISAAY